MTDRIVYRFKFSKLSRVRFIGHLDLLNVFQRSLNRAKLPVAYSQGFNPHQEISFALPLSLGYHSVGEYMDVIFTEKVSEEEIKNRLNPVLPEGLKILGVRKLNKGEKNSASVISAALYEVYLPEGSKIDESHVKQVLESKVIEVVKKSKKKEAITDIRGDIFDLKYREEQGKKIVEMFVAAGSGRNLKAELLIKHLCALAGEEYIAYKTGYRRIEMYSECTAEGKNGHISLMESGN